MYTVTVCVSIYSQICDRYIADRINLFSCDFLAVIFHVCMVTGTTQTKLLQDAVVFHVTYQ